MKGGTGPLMEVYRYAEPVTAKGLVFMDTPGYDPVSATGQIAGGANLIAFTTGRGSCFGAKPAPSLKLATNTPMFERMKEDMDINCGEILDGTCTIEEMGQRIFEQLLRTASGREDEERAARPRRPRIRALEDRHRQLGATTWTWPGWKGSPGFHRR